MAIAINGTDLSLQPSEHGWQARDSIGTSGDAHSIYPAIREYRLTFVLESPADFNQLVNFINLVSTTGTLSVTLPTYGAASYVFSQYSGCVLREVEYGGYFEGFYQEVRLIIGNIRGT